MQRPSQSMRIVGAAMALSGVCSFVFLATASRTLDPRDYSRLATAWTLLYLLEPAFFAPVGQVMARNLAAGRVKDDRGLLDAALRIGVVNVSVLVGLGLALRGVVRDDLFDGDTALYAVVLLALPSQFALAMAWGFSTGRLRYVTYARLFAADALVRATTAAVLGASGVRRPAVFALAFVAGPIVALWWNRHALRPPRGDRAAPDRRRAASRSVLHQMVSSSIAIAMLSLGPIIVKLLAGPAERAEAGRFQNALTVSQAPLLLLGSVLVVLLPTMSGFVARGEVRRLGRFLASALGLHLVGSVIAVLGGAWLGPIVVRTAYGAEYAVRSTDFALLVAAAACFFGAQIVTQGLLALARERSVMIAYAAGGIAMAGLLSAQSGLVRRVETAFLAGTATAYGVGLVLLAGHVGRLARSPVRPMPRHPVVAQVGRRPGPVT